jgi:transcriptional regulator with XRE-family HTH domain
MKGEGKMEEKKLFGEFFKACRIAIKKTLRQFCFENGLDPGNISKLERGLLPPPQSREKLEEYASCLKIKKGSDGWYTFFDLAAAETGKIPEDIMEKEKIEDKLPILFRTLRGQKVSDENLEKLIKMLRDA